MPCPILGRGPGKGRHGGALWVPGVQSGMTALELAVLGGRLAVAKLLLQKGASMEPQGPVCCSVPLLSCQPSSPLPFAAVLIGTHLQQHSASSLIAAALSPGLLKELCYRKGQCRALGERAVTVLAALSCIAASSQLLSWGVPSGLPGAHACRAARHSSTWQCRQATWRWCACSWHGLCGGRGEAQA